MEENGLDVGVTTDEDLNGTVVIRFRINSWVHITYCLLFSDGLRLADSNT